MRHAICYRENETGKPECDRKMRAELNALTPRGKREKVDRQLLRSIIGLKHRLGMGIWSRQLADELHKPVKKRFQKRSVFAKQVDDMSPYSRSNSGYKYLLTVIDVLSKYGWIVPLKTKMVRRLRWHSRNSLPPLVACRRTRVRNSTSNS